MNTYIKGEYKKSLFIGDNGYLVGLFKVKDADKINSDYINKTVIFTGYFHEINDSDTYIFYGSFVNHKKYGEQFSVDKYERVMPEEKDAIVDFLSSDLFKGIGEAKAKKIVNALGKNTLDIIMKNPEKLESIPSITKKQAKLLHDTLEEYQSSYKIILKLQELGFNTKDSMIIYSKYKNRTLEVIEDNIYRLFIDIKEISFKKIDSIALNTIEYDDTRRIEAGIIYVMNEIYFNLGHSYLYLEEIYSYLIRALNNRIDMEKFNEAIKNLKLDLELINKENNYYLRYMYEDEVLISNTVKYLISKKDLKLSKLDSYLDNYEEIERIKYNEEQKQAIKLSLTKHFFIITGGPGTGKTTIVRAILDLYRSINKLSYKETLEKVQILAPTGRAAKRLTETTYLPASTIHRFLKWNKDLDKFQVNEHNKSDVEFVIIDEASMVDVNLFASLLRGLKKDVRIIMVGDYNQLPSVGPGQVLKDLIESDKVEKVILKNLYRQAKGSNIVTLAYDLNKGNIDKNLFEDDYLKLIEVPSSKLIDSIKDICIEYKDSDYKDFQILVPMYKTINGIDNINKIAQDIFNPKDPKKNEIKVGDVIYRENDKVLELTNMPDENIYNGDIGIISKIDKKDIYIDFYGNIVKFTPANFINFKHGYAISIHKSQGSEFKTVVIPVSPEYKKMLYRKLYYTGVTRAKERLYIIGDYNSLVSASLNNSYDIRRTTIKDLLKIS